MSTVTYRYWNVALAFVLATFKLNDDLCNDAVFVQEIISQDFTE